MAESESILTSIKASLGLPEAHTAFDTELVMYINSVLSRLTQLGVGPDVGFRISDASASWEDFIGPGAKLNNVKSYMHLRVKMLHDPPDIGFVLTAMKEEIEQEEWRLMVEVDPPLVKETVVVDVHDIVLDGGGP